MLRNASFDEENSLSFSSQIDLVKLFQTYTVDILLTQTVQYLVFGASANKKHYRD